MASDTRRRKGPSSAASTGSSSQRASRCAFVFTTTAPAPNGPTQCSARHADVSATSPPGSGARPPSGRTQSTRERRLWRGRPLASVPILEPHDVVELRRRHLDDRRVIERRHAVDGAGLEAEVRRRRDDLLAQHGLPHLSELDLRAPRLDVPRLVLHAVELQAEGLARTDEQHLADEAVGLGPDQLPAPRLVDPARVDRPRVEAEQVRRLRAHAGTAASSGCARTNSSASRSCFGVLTVSQKLVLRYAAIFPSAASSGNVVSSWSPRSGRRSRHSSSSTYTPELTHCGSTGASRKPVTVSSVAPAPTPTR